MSLAGPNRKPALTAAASKIGYSRIQAGKLKDEPWQDRAWDVYDKLGPVYYMTRYRSAVARKIDYFAAKKDSPGADPDNDVTYNDEGEIISEGPATKALEVEGGPELIRRIVSELMVHWDVAGEAYLVRFEEAPFWRILSTQELRTHTGGYAWMDDDIVKEVIDRDNVFRVWKPHPRNHWQADSPTRHVLEDAEGLILSGREIRARSQSRLSAGLWMIPDTVDFTPFGEDESGTEDDFARQLTAHLARPLSDPGSAASLVPWIVTMDRTDIPIAKEGFIDFARDWDISIELREEQLNHVALGIDMPPELATGTAGSMNHWGSWWLTDEAVNMHVLPTVDDILDSLSINWFRPLLTVDPASYVIWRDPSPATVQADQSDIAARAYELGAISGKAYRRAINMDEEDAPDPEELAERAALKAPTTDDTIEQAPPVRGSGDSPLPGAAVTAAVRRRIVATELADLDAELLAWVVEESDKEIERLLNLALSAALDPIDESLLEPLAQRLERKIAQAQAQARGWLTRTLGRTPSDEGESLARSQGVQVIIAGIVEAVRRKLFTPDARPDPIDLGRMPDITTPTEAIRNGLSLAGGGPAVYEDGNTSELIGNGQKVKEELAGDGFFVDGYEWKYGNPANVFEPHLRLDGIQFTSWDDPRLAVGFNDSWLRRSHYRPGDHKGCQCAFVQVIIEPPTSAAELSGVPGSTIAPTGMTPEEAAEYAATRADLIARYPQAAATVRHWGTGEDALSRAALRENIQDNWVYHNARGDTVRARQLSNALDDLDAGDTFDSAYAKAFQDNSRLNGINFRHHDGTSTIVVRPGIAEQSAPLKVNTNFSPTRYTTIHEFGHAVEHDLLTRLGDRTPLSGTINVEVGTRTVQDAILRAGYNARVSRYGDSNPTEGFAELFVDYESGGPAGNRMQLLLDLARDAERWPSFANAADSLMSPTEWFGRLYAIGADLPPGEIGVFKP